MNSTSFGEYVDNPNVLSLNSGTAALHIALMLAGVGPDDEVISTALTADRPMWLSNWSEPKWFGPMSTLQRA